LTLIREIPLKVSYMDPTASVRLTNKLSGYFKQLRHGKKIVVVCLGTDRSTGDSLGPLAGTALGKYRSALFDVYGTLEKPVHAMNLDETLGRLYGEHRNPFVIGIDASLGQAASIGSIHIGDGPIRPGAGVNKQLTPVGDIHISGVVNVGGMMEYLMLQTTRLHLVVSMAELIARSLFVAAKLSAADDKIR